MPDRPQVRSGKSGGEEQTIAELKNGPLAHLPSGSYAANAAWVACAVIAFNLARAAAVAAGLATARWDSLRTRIMNTPARVAATGRRLILHLPAGWSGQSPSGSTHPRDRPFRGPDTSITAEPQVMEAPKTKRQS